MKALPWLLAGCAIGGMAGWFVRGGAVPGISDSASFSFIDKLADQTVAYLSATGTWRGHGLVNKINTVRIQCDRSKSFCEMH